jgi:hypothetical protein
MAWWVDLAAVSTVGGRRPSPRPRHAAGDGDGPASWRRPDVGCAPLLASCEHVLAGVAAA